MIMDPHFFQWFLKRKPYCLVKQFLFIEIFKYYHTF